LDLGAIGNVNQKSKIKNHKCPGDEREMESGLIFNQLICEFESRHPRQDIFDCQLPIADWFKVQRPTSTAKLNV
jgi:hypothetical protein